MERIGCPVNLWARTRYERARLEVKRPAKKKQTTANSPAPEVPSALLVKQQRNRERAERLGVTL